MEDFRYAFRALWKDPGFTIPAVLALALSIGANTSVFTVVKSVLLEPLPMKQPGQLLAVYQIRPDGQQFPFNIPFYLDVRERNRVFQDVAAQGFWNANLTGEANPERLLGVRATGNFFTMLGVEAAVGRIIVPEDARPESPKVVVLTWKLWQRRYGGRRDVVGSNVRLNGEPYTVIGVLPQSFSFRSVANEFAVPLVIETDPFRDARVSTAFLRVFSRLKPGVTPAQASGDLDRVARDLRREYPTAAAGMVSIASVSMREDLTGPSRETLTTLMFAVALVLLIACADVSSLLVAKASGRRREMANGTAAPDREPPVERDGRCARGGSGSMGRAAAARAEPGGVAAGAGDTAGFRRGGVRSRRDTDLRAAGGRSSRVAAEPGQPRRFPPRRGKSQYGHSSAE